MYYQSKECLEHCVHYDITEDLIKRAIEEEKNIQKQKGRDNASTLLLNTKRDYIGSIAHNGVCDWIEETGLSFSRSPYFSNAISADEYDFLYGRKRVDVQTTPLRPDRYGNRTIHRYTSFLVKNEKEHKPMDYFCLTAVDLQENRLHIAGVIPFDEVFTIDSRAKGVIHPAHQIYATQLKGLRNFIYKI